MMVTLFTVCSTIRSKVVTTVLVRLTFIVWLRFLTQSSTSAWLKAFLSAREYGGLLDNRSFGGAQVSRTFYARGQTGQQLLLGAYSALSQVQIGLGKVKMYTRHEMLDVVKVDGRARGIIARNLITGKIERYAAHAVVVATGGYVNTFFLSTNAMASNGSAAWQCYKKGAYFANPCMVQIHPTCVPVKGDFQSKLTLMSESLRNDGRIWVPKKLEDAKALQAGTKKGKDIPEADRDYYLERRYPAFGNLVPRDVASRAAKERCDAGFRREQHGLGRILGFLRTRSIAWVKRSLSRNTVTCSICTKRSRTIIHTRLR